MMGIIAGAAGAVVLIIIVILIMAIVIYKRRQTQGKGEEFFKLLVYRFKNNHMTDSKVFIEKMVYLTILIV